MNIKEFDHFIGFKDTDNALAVTYATTQDEILTRIYPHGEIKKCPFCGSGAHLKPTATLTEPCFGLVCGRCHAGILPVFARKHLDADASIDGSFQGAIGESIRQWNTRTS